MQVVEGLSWVLEMVVFVVGGFVGVSGGAGVGQWVAQVLSVVVFAFYVAVWWTLQARFYDQVSRKGDGRVGG